MIQYIAYLSLYIGLFTITYYLISLTNHKQIKYKPFFPKVSIFIAARNEAESIKDTIKSALEIDYPKNKMEILVIVNNSSDDTYKNALEIKDSRLKVFNLKQGGKANAINFALTKATGEYIVTMDADTYAESDVLQKMMPYFGDKDAMCVSPSMVIYKPKGILQRVQQIEYFLGVYLRKAFSTIDAVHITPGAFSAYRRSFFEKYGGFDVGNMTEDMEVALRINYNNFKIIVVDDAVVYTKCPNKFSVLLNQRRRWYYGLVKNLWNYKELFTKKYGELGLIVLPSAVITIILSIILTSYLFYQSIINIQRSYNLLQSINFDFVSLISFNKFFISDYLFRIFSNPLYIFSIFTLIVFIGYMFYVKARVKKYSSFGLSLVFFLFFYTLLFTFWWLVTFFFVIFKKSISWGGNKKI